MTHRISVIIPLHNGARFISATLRSVAEQTVKPAQIIVVDDHSSDEGAELAATFAGVEVINATGRGPAAARQLGIEHANGTRIAFLDHDDLWAPWHLAQLGDAMDRHPQCGFVFANAQPFTDGTEPRFGVNTGIDVAVDPWAWQPSCYILSPSCTLFDRGALQQAGGWQAAVPVADLGTYLRLSADAPVRQCSQSVGYRQSANSNALRLRRAPEQLLADHIATLKSVLPARSNPTTRAQLSQLEQLGALDAGDRLTLVALADALAKLPENLPHVLSHAHWLYGPRWRERQNARLIELQELWPAAHATTPKVRRWLQDCLSFAQLRAHCFSQPFHPGRWHALASSSWRRAIRRIRS